MLQEAKRQKLDETESAKSSETLEQAESSGGRHWTLSIALPASILLNAQSPELRTYLAGQIARAAAIFSVDEVVVYDEYALSADDVNVAFDERKKCVQHLAKILSYLECPQYLRKHLFPIQKDLQYAGLLNPLDCVHHLKTHDLNVPFREGIVSNKPVKQGRDNQGSYIYVGLEQEVQIDKVIKPGVRVTVEFDPSQLQDSVINDSNDAQNRRSRKRKLRGKAVAPSTPRTKGGLYWGYTVRTAGSLSAVINECPYGGYDLLIGTSERGDSVDKVREKLSQKFNHALIVFGGLKGIEAALENDEKLPQVDDARDLFKFYLNTCPGQGSNTIRTEEALLITLSALRPFLTSAHDR